MSEVSASIVLYNTRQKDLLAVARSYQPSAQRILYLIDNSPVAMQLPEELQTEFVHYVFIGRNLGYGSGHNIAIRKAIEMGSKYHVVLNPDILFESEVIDALVEKMDQDDRIGHIMPRIVNQEGELQYLCKLVPTPKNLILKRFLPKRITRKQSYLFQLKFADYNKEMDVPYLSGCFMFFRVEALKKVGLFDERFFMYPEDIDITRRIHKEYRTVYYPNVQIIHAHAAESYKSKKMLKIHITNMIKYFNKWGWVFDSERRRINKEVLKALNYKEKTNQ